MRNLTKLNTNTKSSSLCQDQFAIIYFHQHLHIHFYRNPKWLLLRRPTVTYYNSPYYKKDIKLIEGVQRRATKLITGMLGSLNYDDRLKQLGLMKLERQRMRSDLVETFKIVNGKYNINPELFF